MTGTVPLRFDVVVAPLALCLVLGCSSNKSTFPGREVIADVGTQFVDAKGDYVEHEFSFELPADAEGSGRGGMVDGGCHACIAKQGEHAERRPACPRCFATRAW
ncbi:MAG: hypothetical protein ACK5Q5_13510, partial [Planctomycetaceae bacterium]